MHSVTDRQTDRLLGRDGFSVRQRPVVRSTFVQWMDRQLGKLAGLATADSLTGGTLYQTAGLSVGRTKRSTARLVSDAIELSKVNVKVVYSC